MSASLVGSEMCIRDSGLRLRILQASKATSKREGEQIKHACKYVGTHAPVSYTHLTLPTICSV
eukprot:1395427-Alexandrium_andersonii.AAC.1